MPTISDYLYQQVLGAVQPFGNVWVQLVNNATNTPFVSTSVTTPQGLFSINVPAGLYTVNTGPTSIGPWTATGDANYSVPDRLDWYNIRDFGAKGDGVTDDSSAITAAMTAATAGGNGIVYAPATAASYTIGSRIVQPFGVEWRGAGRSASLIKALPTFPINTELIRLGDLSGSIGVGCRIRGLAIDCNNITGSTAVYSERINENSGVYESMIRNYGAFGIRINQPGAGSQPQNFSIDDVEIFSGTGTGAGAVGVAITATSLSIPFREISRVTVFATGSTQLTTAIQIDGALAGVVREIHVENAVNGVLVGPVLGCFGTVFQSMTGNANVTNLLVFSNATTSQNLIALGIAPQGATNSIVDQITSTTLTAEQSIYFMGAGAAAQRAVVSGDSTFGSRFKVLKVTQSLQPPTPAGALQTGQVFQGSGVPSNANGNNGDVYFRTDTPGTANQRMYMKSAGAWVALTL